MARRAATPESEPVRLTQSFAIDGHPPTLNQLMRGKLRDRIRLGKAWRSRVALAARRAGIVPATGKRRVTVRLTLVKGQRGCDPDAIHKATGDSLVKCGALKGDSRHWIEWAPTEYERGEAMETTIILEDL